MSLNLHQKDLKDLFDTKQVKSRFAPSPTGYLHLGHILSAMFVWSITKYLNGKVYLRIEDHDQTRSKTIYKDAILDDLDRLGFLHDPSTASIIEQSTRNTLYEQYFVQLQNNCKIFACNCSRSALQNMNQQKRQSSAYSGGCHLKKIHATDLTIQRLIHHKMIYQFHDLNGQLICENCYDKYFAVALKDRNQNWTYLFSSTCDDIQDGINLIIRGEDLLHSTCRQLDIRNQFGISEHPTYFHHPLIYEQSQKIKLSKRFASERAVDTHSSFTVTKLFGKAAAAIGLCKEGYKLSLDDFTELIFSR